MEKTGLKRNTIDKYYTVSQTVDICMRLLIDKVKINPNDLCIEPSAGDGAFIAKIKSVFHNYKFYDIQPEHPEIIKKDYLTFQLSDINNGDIGSSSASGGANRSNNNLNCYDRIHLLGNPPFGRQSSLAIKLKSSASSTPLFLISPLFTKMLSNPEEVGILDLCNKSLVFLL